LDLRTFERLSGFVGLLCSVAKQVLLLRLVKMFKSERGGLDVEYESGHARELYLGDARCAPAKIEEMNENARKKKSAVNGPIINRGYSPRTW